MLRLDGDPTEAIYTSVDRILFSIPHTITLLAACEIFVFEFFGFLHIPLLFQVFFSQLFLFSFFSSLKTVRMLFLEYEMHISAMLKFLGLNCDIALYLFLHKSFDCCYSAKILLS
jgi:hypothetical protein